MCRSYYFLYCIWYFYFSQVKNENIYSASDFSARCTHLLYAYYCAVTNCYPRYINVFKHIIIVGKGFSANWKSIQKCINWHHLTFFLIKFRHVFSHFFSCMYEKRYLIKWALPQQFQRVSLRNWRNCMQAAPSSI